MQGSRTRRFMAFVAVIAACSLLAGRAASAPPANQAEPALPDEAIVDESAIPDAPIPAAPPVDVAESADIPATQAEMIAQPAAPSIPVGPGASPVAEVARVDNDRIHEIHFRDVELAAALRMLTMSTKDNVILSSQVDGRMKVEANLYDVTFEQVLDAVLTPLGLVYTRQNNFIYVFTRKEMSELARTAAGQSAIFKLHYIPAADAALLIKPLLSPNGVVAVTAPASVGIETGTGATGGNSYATEDALVVSDTPEKIQEITAALRELDVRPRQVLVEATILRATLDDDNALGVDFNSFGGIDFNNLNRNIVDPTTFPVTSAGVDGGVPQTPHWNDLTTFNTRTDFIDQAMIARGGLSFGILKNNIAVFVRALETVTDTTVVANPKVLALNKQKGEVIVGRRDGYLTTIQTETESTQQVEFLETGVQLIFRPFIGDDGYVRMELHPKDSTGGLTAANLPFEETTEVTTNVLVKDGHTIVIGGLFREQTTMNKAQIPILGNIPYAGMLFRRKRDTTRREEVIILLTVHLVENNARYAAAGEKALEDVERIRVGARSGLACYGRERLAEAHYKWAVEHLARGHRLRAHWDLIMATHLNPRYMDAIALRDELSSGRAWEGNTTIIRNFIYNRLLDAEDRWIDSLGLPAAELTVPPDCGSPEWGEVKRTMKGPNPNVPDSDVIVIPQSQRPAPAVMPGCPPTPLPGGAPMAPMMPGEPLAPAPDGMPVPMMPGETPTTMPDFQPALPPDGVPATMPDGELDD